LLPDNGRDKINDGHKGNIILVIITDTEHFRSDPLSGTNVTMVISGPVAEFKLKEMMKTE
jgi:hypothetical protein